MSFVSDLRSFSKHNKGSKRPVILLFFNKQLSSAYPLGHPCLQQNLDNMTEALLVEIVILLFIIFVSQGTVNTHAFKKLSMHRYILGYKNFAYFAI